MPTASSCVLMVPPEGFQYNQETASSNAFQQTVSIELHAEKAMQEFVAMKLTLEKKGIRVLILQQDKHLPDAVFPNNWFSTHISSTGRKLLIIYPLLTPNRQAEVNVDGLLSVLHAANLNYDEVIDLRDDKSQILEGTGSLVLDREHQQLYACLSPRTSESQVLRVAQLLDYEPILFRSVDSHNQPIYHTNVIMASTQHYALICLESIHDPIDKQRVIRAITAKGKEIIDLSFEQVLHMCGNVLELFNDKQQSLIILSNQALYHLTDNQRASLQQYSELLPVSIPTIETIGGGSARCMLAEIATANA